MGENAYHPRNDVFEGDNNASDDKNPSSYLAAPAGAAGIVLELQSARDAVSVFYSPSLLGGRSSSHQCHEGRLQTARRNQQEFARHDGLVVVVW